MTGKSYISTFGIKLLLIYIQDNRNSTENIANKKIPINSHKKPFFPRQSGFLQFIEYMEIICSDLLPISMN